MEIRFVAKHSKPKEEPLDARAPSDRPDGHWRIERKGFFYEVNGVATAHAMAACIFEHFADVQVLLLERVAAGSICVRTIPALPPAGQAALRTLLWEEGALGIHWLIGR